MTLAAREFKAPLHDRRPGLPVAGVLDPRAATALSDLTAVAGDPDVVAHSGPFPVGYLTMQAGGRTVRTVVEARDADAAAVDQPRLITGGWIRPGSAVVEHAFAGALGVHPGDTVTVEGRPLRVAGTAITASRSAYPSAGWRAPGQGVATESSGLIWVGRGDLPPDLVTTYVLKLRIADPAGTAITAAVELALFIAAAATVIPVIRATTTSTIHALTATAARATRR